MELGIVMSLIYLIIIVGALYTSFHGMYLAFKAHFLLGLFVLFVPFIANIFSLGKIFGKVDLAENAVNSLKGNK